MRHLVRKKCYRNKKKEHTTDEKNETKSQDKTEHNKKSDAFNFGRNQRI